METQVWVQEMRPPPQNTLGKSGKSTMNTYIFNIANKQ